MNILDILQRTALELINLKSANAQLMSDLVLTIGRINANGQEYVLFVGSDAERAQYMNVGTAYSVLESLNESILVQDEKGRRIWLDKSCFISLTDYKIEPEPVEQKPDHFQVFLAHTTGLKDFMRDFYSDWSAKITSDVVSREIYIDNALDREWLNNLMIEYLDFRKISYNILYTKGYEGHNKEMYNKITIKVN